MDNDSNRSLTFAKTDSSAFDLTSLDIGLLQTISGNTSLVITGTQDGGGTVQRTLTYGTGLTTINFSGDWADLTSVRFENNPLGNFVVTWFALDNIQYDGLSSVPEPSSFVLLGLATIGMTMLTRRRNHRVIRTN